MSPTQPTISPIPTSTPSQSPKSTSSKWHTLAAISITLFLILLLASTIALCHLHRRKTSLQAVVNGQSRTHTHTHPQSTSNPTQRANPNSHPFGSNPWRDHELAQVPPASRDALRVADLEAQNNLLEQRAEVLEGLADMLERQNRRLGRQNAELRLNSYDAAAAAAVLDPDVLRRVKEEVHRPAERRAGAGKTPRGGSGGGGFELQEVRGGGDALLEVSGLGSFVVGVDVPANDESGCFSVKPHHDPDTDPTGRGMLLVADNHRESSCSVGTSDAVISDRPRSLAFHFAVESGRSRSPSGFSGVSKDFTGQHVRDAFEDEFPGIYEMAMPEGGRVDPGHDLEVSQSR